MTPSNAIDALSLSETQLQSGWDAVADTIHDALLGFMIWREERGEA